MILEFNFTAHIFVGICVCFSTKLVEICPNYDAIQCESCSWRISRLS